MTSSGFIVKIEEVEVLEDDFLNLLPIVCNNTNLAEQAENMMDLLKDVSRYYKEAYVQVVNVNLKITLNADNPVTTNCYYNLAVAFEDAYIKSIVDERDAILARVAKAFNIVSLPE